MIIQQKSIKGRNARARKQSQKLPLIRFLCLQTSHMHIELGICMRGVDLFGHLTQVFRSIVVDTTPRTVQQQEARSYSLNTNWRHPRSTEYLINLLGSAAYWTVDEQRGQDPNTHTHTKEEMRCISHWYALSGAVDALSVSQRCSFT